MQDVFDYNGTDFISCVSALQFKPSRFDEICLSKWNEKMKTGAFKYILHIDKEVIVKGRYGFMILVNENRVKLKKATQQISHFSQPFDPNEFNFTKVPEDDVIFSFKNVNGDLAVVGDDIIRINAYPAVYGHILLCPDVYRCLPQIMTLHGLRSAVDLCRLSGDPNFRVGFNSICGSASVNHLHIHGLYLNQRMKLETIETEHVAGSCYKLVSFPSHGFVFHLEDDDGSVDEKVKHAFLLVNYLNSHQIPYNICITRGTSLAQDIKAANDIYTNIRMYIWARKTTVAYPPDKMSSPAFLEVFGCFICSDLKHLDELTEELLSSILNDLTKDLFFQILPDVTKIYEHAINVK